MQDVDAAPAGLRVRRHGLEFGIFGDVGLEGHRGAALGGDQVDGFLRRFETVIHAHDARAFARKGQRGGAAVADTFAGALAGADDDGDTIFQTHVSSLPGSGTVAVPLYNGAHCRSSWWRVPGPRRSRK